MGRSLCSRSLWLLSRVETRSRYSKKKENKRIQRITKNKIQEKSPQRSRPLAKVRAIISLHGFYFAGFHQISPPLNLKTPGGDINDHSCKRAYQWSFMQALNSIMIQAIHVAKVACKNQHDHSSHPHCQVQKNQRAINSMSTLHAKIQEERFKVQKDV